MRTFATATFVLVLSATALRAADEYPIKVYPCPKLGAAPKIDGDLSDACWAEATVASGFTYYNKPKLIDVQAAIRIGYDDACLYLAVQCDEPNMKAVAPSHAGRDSSGVFRGETIEVFIDPAHDHENYYQLAANFAESLFDSRGHDRSWDSATRVATAPSEGGWALEMAIPWSDLGVKSVKPGKVIGFNVCRDRYAGGVREWSNWAQTMANFHDPIRFAHLVLSPSEAALGGMAAEFRKGDRRGPILVYGHKGYAGKAYLAMAKESLAELEKRLAGLQAEADKELELGASEEVTKCLEIARVRIEPFREKLRGEEALDSAEWTRMSIAMEKLKAELGTLLWEARLAMLLKEI